MSALLCCRRPRAADMGAALSQEGSCEAAGLPQPPTMADVIRERKKKGGGAALGTLRRRIAAAARRPRDPRPDRGCEHARYIRSIVSTWSVAEVFLLAAELEAGAALRDLAVQADLARPPAPSLASDLQGLLENSISKRWFGRYVCKGVISLRCVSVRLSSTPELRLCPAVSASLWCGARAVGRAARRRCPWAAELEAGAALRDLAVQANLARPPAPSLASDLQGLLENRWWCDVELVGCGWSLPAHRAILAARSAYFRHLLPRHPNARRVPLEGAIGSWPRDVMAAAILVLYGHTCNTSGWDRGAGSDTELDNAESSQTNTWDQRPRHACCSSGGTLRRLTTALLASRAALHSDANYLLDSGQCGTPPGSLRSVWDAPRLTMTSNHCTAGVPRRSTQ
ncbi:BTB/POZ domain-containing protein 7 [Plutella xylostella]|uniref:BTB/POZ domain-containing protein 7 n=1 Tax=Plutella xylostella TaxID=51655 RepID=UPI002033069E|nr:BTB/POZ domain-containing protein 7 [Plutella xylostella]